VVVDDALMQVTHVVRGEDHISNTPRQILLYEALGFAAPIFAHLSLVMGPDHSPLSKRHGATSVAEFRAKGYLPEALVNYLALIGWSPGGNDELLPIDELARRFKLDTVGHSAGVFDEEKLAWANRHDLNARDLVHLVAFAGPRYPAPSPEGEQLAAWERAVSLSPDRAEVWHELLDPIFGHPVLTVAYFEFYKYFLKGTGNGGLATGFCTSLASLVADRFWQGKTDSPTIQKADVQKMLTGVHGKLLSRESLLRFHDQGRDVASSGNADNSTHVQPFLFLRALFRARIFSAMPDLATCRARPMARASFSIFSVMVLPAAI